ncbi:hypothetical protein BH23CHL2_BH23CHL2_26900 [soil metagenome]
MDAMTKTRGHNIGAIIATLIAAALIGVFALMLMGRESTSGSNDVLLSEPSLPQQARYPQLGEKFAPGRIIQTATVATYAAPCHGEGLMDTEIQTMLVGADGSVAEYCDEPRAYTASVPGDTDQESGVTYPEPCHGEALLVPMDPAPYNEGPGSIAEFCTSGGALDSQPEGENLFPSNDGPLGDPRNH